MHGMYIYIYIYRERERVRDRDRERDVYSISYRVYSIVYNIV